MSDELFDGLADRFMKSGERDRIQNVLLARLESDGWVERIRRLARQEISNQGIEQATEEGLIEKLTLPGRKSVPDAAKHEIYELINDWFRRETNIDL